MFFLVIGSFGDDVTLSARTRIIHSSVASFPPGTRRGIAWYCANRMRVLFKRQGFLFVCLFNKIFQGLPLSSCWEVFRPRPSMRVGKVLFSIPLEGRREDPVAPFKTMQSLELSPNPDVLCIVDWSENLCKYLSLIGLLITLQLALSSGMGWSVRHPPPKFTCWNYNPPASQDVIAFGTEPLKRQLG